MAHFAPLALRRANTACPVGTRHANLRAILIARQRSRVTKSLASSEKLLLHVQQLDEPEPTDEATPDHSNRSPPANCTAADSCFGIVSAFAISACPSSVIRNTVASPGVAYGA